MLTLALLVSAAHAPTEMPAWLDMFDLLHAGEVWG